MAVTMGSYFGARSHSPKTNSPRPYSQSAHSQSSLFASSSPISNSAPVLPPLPAQAMGLGLDTDFSFDVSPQQATASSSSAASTPSPARDDDLAPRQRPQRLAAGRSVTSPVGALPKQKSTSPASPLVAFSVPYSSTTAQAKPRSGDRPLLAESTVNGVPQHAKTSKQRPELHSHKSAKTKFNLLNPVSLLMRRRSAQVVETLDKAASKGLTVPRMNLPDDYDPRIRGNVVHDFSAPRTRRTPSYEPSQEPSPKPSTARDSIQSQQDFVERDPNRQSIQHAPVFVEHIDADQDHDQNQNRIHAETLANNDFIARNNSWGHGAESLSMPPFGRKSQQLDEQHVSFAIQQQPQEPQSASSKSDLSTFSTSQGPNQVQDHPQSPFSPEPAQCARPESYELDAEQTERHWQDERQTDHHWQDINHNEHRWQETDHAHPQWRDDHHSEPRWQDTNHAESYWQDRDHQTQSANHPEPSRASGLPKHLTSSASRFSFQIANDSIAEEKLLEEKHKLRQSQAVKEQPFEDDEYEYEDDMFDEDAMYDHDEIEDMGSNGFYEHRNSGLPERMSGMTLESHRGHLSVASSSTLYSTSSEQMGVASRSPLGSNPPPASLYQHQPGMSIDAAVAQPMQDPSSPASPNSLYFDDGMIEGINDVHEEEAFDEDQFDDPTYLKKPPKTQEAATSPPPPDIDIPVHSVNGYPFHIQNPGTGHFSADSPFSDNSSQPGENHQEAPRHDSQQGPYENHSLAAYHSALAEAAQKAAADGKFTRQNSVAASESVYSDDHDDSEHDYYQQQPQLQPQPAYSHQRFMSESTNQSRQSYSGFDFGFNDGSTIEDTFSSPEFPSDDFDLDDSDMISAANAEALANDEEGFYSQEFGFYAKSRPGSGPDAAEAIHGGYFGPPGIEIIRQKSVKEPNLTPITERSEFSTRNSYIGPFSPLAAALPSPGFPPAHMQAARMSPLQWAHMQEDEMTLADLRRLKQGTFGAGSSSSLHSASSSFGGQPYSPVMTAPNPGGYFMPRGSFGGVPMAWQRSSDSNSNYNPSNHSSSPIAASPVHVASSLANSQTLSSPAHIPNNLPNNPTLSSPMYMHTNNNQLMSSPLQHPATFLIDENLSTPKKTSSSPQETPTTPVTAKKSTPASANGSSSTDHPPWQTHHNSNSAADNITYVREEDSAGAKRWVLERRRTSEAGLLELIGREVVEGI